jgi:hypothetical protein
MTRPIAVERGGVLLVFLGYLLELLRVLLEPLGGLLDVGRVGLQLLQRLDGWCHDRRQERHGAALEHL